MYNFGACELIIALEIPSIHKFEITLVENPVELWITQLNPDLVKVRAS